MQNITIQHGVGDTVWLWAPSVGSEPVQMKIEAVTIWLDDRWRNRPKVFYNFEYRDDVRLVSRVIEESFVFSSYLEAKAYQNDYMADLREDMIRHGVIR